MTYVVAIEFVQKILVSKFSVTISPINTMTCNPLAMTCRHSCVPRRKKIVPNKFLRMRKSYNDDEIVLRNKLSSSFFTYYHRESFRFALLSICFFSLALQPAHSLVMLLHSLCLYSFTHCVFICFCIYSVLL